MKTPRAGVPGAVFQLQLRDPSIGHVSTWGDGTMMIVYCSFCGRHHSEVWKIVKGDDCAICDRCADAVVKTLIDERAKDLAWRDAEILREAVERDAWAETGP